MSKYEDLERLQELKDNGSINQSEFETEKMRILNNDAVTKTSGIYVASLILGICAFLLSIVPILGIILCIVSTIICCLAKKKLKRNNEKNGKVTAGLICTIIGIVIAIAINGIMMFTILTYSIEGIESVGKIERLEKTYEVEIGIKYSCISNNEVRAIIFKNNNEFEMNSGFAYSECITETGTYAIDGNILKLTFYYDSSTDYENVDNSKEPVIIEMTILDDGNIKEVIEHRTYLYIKEGTNISIDNTSDTSTDLLDTIYGKYPDLKNKDGYICTDGEQYWLLDKAGKKIYFYDMESFESALVQSYTSEVDIEQEQTETNNQIDNQSDNQSNKSTNSNNVDNKQNFNDNSEISNVQEIWINKNDIMSCTEEELYKFLNNNNLKYNVTQKVENIAYLDGRVGKSEFEFSRYGEYKCEDTVEIIKTTYKGIPWNVNLMFSDLVDVFIDYNGGKCAFSKYPAGDYTGFLENPEGKDIYYVQRGMNYYIDNKLLNSTDNYYKFTFNNEKTAILKCVVPYLYSNNEQKVIGQNITIYQNTINLTELYNRGGEIKKIELPSRYD